MKWVNLSLFIVLLVLLVVGVSWSWHDFNNAEILTHGGYLYNDEGQVIGMWDGWDKANYPTWMFPIWLIISLIIDMPLWWMVAFLGIGIWLMFYYVLPHILTRNGINA